MPGQGKALEVNDALKAKLMEAAQEIAEVRRAYGPEDRRYLDCLRLASEWRDAARIASKMAVMPTGNPPLGMRPDPEWAARVARVLAADPLRTAAAVYSGNRFRLIVSIDHGWLHASISHAKRYPTWNEIKAVRDWAFPSDMEVVMVLPRAMDYVNIHQTTFHLWTSACGEEGRNAPGAGTLQS